MEGQKCDSDVATIKTVGISGGTHGNELIGVYLVREWLKRPELVQRSSFTKTHLIIGNPVAVEKCVRYIDVDLNRQFAAVNLDSEDEANHPYEVRRARELENEFGASSKSNQVDFWLDLHNTTANTAVCLTVPFKMDSLSLSVAAALQVKFGDCIRVIRLPPVHESGSNVGNPSRSSGIINIGRHGLGLEVGPLAHGTLSASMYNHTKSIVYYILDVLDTMNKGWKPERDVIEVYEPFEKVDYPRNEVGEISGMLHPGIDGKDWEVLNPGDAVFIKFDGETVPYSGQEPAYPIFINEAAYMEKRVALILTKKTKISISSDETQCSGTTRDHHITVPQDIFT